MVNTSGMSAEKENSISVIIATKNRRSLLERALLSIENQEERPREIIIVNDGSSDYTKEFLDTKYSGGIYTLIHNKRSYGVNKSRNEGIKAATSEWVTFLDDDDEFLPDSIAKLKRKIEETSNDISVFYLNNLIKTDKGEFIGGFQFKKGEEEFSPTYEEVMEKFGLKGDSSPVMKRSLFTLGNYWFPEGINGFESMTIKNIAKDGHLIKYYPDLLKKVDLSSSFEHLSNTSSKYNPQNILSFQLEEINTHYLYYKTSGLLFKRYLDISKFAFKNLYLYYALKYLIAFILYSFALFPKYIFRIIGTQRWIRLGLRYRIILNLKTSNYEFKVSFFGYTYSGKLSDYIDKYVFYFGAYEREELLFLKKYLNQNSVVLDVGANSGHHSLFFSRYAMEVYSFEPYKKLFEKIKRKIYDNDINNIHANNFGLGQINEELDFYAPQGKNEGIGSFIPSEGKVNAGRMIIKNGDEYLNSLSINNLDLIKIDVEGFELHVLKGLRTNIKKFRPVIFAELNAESQSMLQSTLGEIASLYEFFIIDANNPYLYLFNKPGCLLTKFKPSDEMKNVLMLPKTY